MFLMTSDIRVTNTSAGGVKTVFRNIKPSAVKWKVSVSNFTDTCQITLPLLPYLTSAGANKTVFSERATAGNTVFTEGDYVEVWLGYYGIDMHLFFRGFIRRIDYAQPLVLECEGFSYQLKDTVFNKSYRQTTLRQVLSDLVKGTDITLSTYIPDMNLSNLTFKNVPGLKMLEWFQKECLCAVSFDFNDLYVGASKYAVPKPTERLRTGWNTVSDSELKKSESDTRVIVNLVEKSSAGTVKRTRPAQSRYDSIKEVKVRAGLPDAFLKAVAGELQKLEDYRGYKGSITAFLMPFFDKGYVCEISDGKFPDRAGRYFVESVEGSFDSSGGRQKLTLIYYGK